MPCQPLHLLATLCLLSSLAPFYGRQSHQQPFHPFQPVWLIGGINPSSRQSFRPGAQINHQTVLAKAIRPLPKKRAATESNHRFAPRNRSDCVALKAAKGRFAPLLENLINSHASLGFYYAIGVLKLNLQEIGELFAHRGLPRPHHSDEPHGFATHWPQHSKCKIRRPLPYSMPSLARAWSASAWIWRCNSATPGKRRSGRRACSKLRSTRRP